MKKEINRLRITRSNIVEAQHNLTKIKDGDQFSVIEISKLLYDAREKINKLIRRLETL